MGPRTRHSSETSRPSDAVRGAVDRFALRIGAAVYDERRRQRMTIKELAARAEVSVGTVHGIENGGRASVEMYVRLAKALGREFDAGIVERMPGQPRLRSQRDDVDIVHAAMGELEVATLAAHDLPARVDEPWQHYHFAGRADVVSWDLARSAFLHLENRTRFPDVQDSLGSFNNKRTYLAGELWRPLGFDRPPRTEVHAIVALWSSEVLRVLRQHPSTFRATCPDPPDAFLAWLRGEPPVGQRVTTLVLFDPFAIGRQRRFLGLDAAIDGARPRIRGYAEAAELLRRTR